MTYSCTRSMDLFIYEYLSEIQKSEYHGDVITIERNHGFSLNDFQITKVSVITLLYSSYHCLRLTLVREQNS